MERHTLLALSTAHLPEEEFEVLAHLSTVELPVRHVGHEYGGIIIIAHGHDLNNFDWTHTPNLRPIVEYCYKENIQYVDFDRDVEVCDEFTKFDW